MADSFIAQFPEFRQIHLSKGYFTIVDAENYEWLNQWKWSATEQYGKVYAERRGQMRNRVRGKTIRMHGQIMSTPPGLVTDHCDGNGLMNTWDNLRVCTQGQNTQNRSKGNKPRTSRYKGVCWYPRDKKWEARISVNGKTHRLGRFVAEIDAARAYNKAALEHFGEFAVINIIELHSIDEAA